MMSLDEEFAAIIVIIDIYAKRRMRVEDICQENFVDLADDLSNLVNSYLCQMFRSIVPV